MLADLLSLVRIPLGVLFIVVADDVPSALAIVAAAGLSDVLDGWVARRGRPDRQGQRHRGDWLDPLCDKLFVAAVMVGIYVHRHPPVSLLLLTMTREVLQTLSLIAYRLLPGFRRLPYNYRAHPIGKVTTVAQFLTAMALLIPHVSARPLAWTSAVLGVMSVIIYWMRVRILVREAGSP